MSSLSEDPSVVGLLWVEEQWELITAHSQQDHTKQGFMVPIYMEICNLESQGVISKTRSPFDSPIWPVKKYNGRVESDRHE